MREQTWQQAKDLSRKEMRQIINRVLGLVIVTIALVRLHGWNPIMDQALAAISIYVLGTLTLILCFTPRDATRKTH